MKNLATKNLVTRTETDPWNAVVGRRPNIYQIPQVGLSLIEQVDHALFERDMERAIRTGVILERWSQRDPHFRTKAPAVMASIYTVCNLNEIAERKLREAKQRIEKRHCLECEGIYHQRFGVHLIYTNQPRESVTQYDKAVALFEEVDNSFEIAKSLMGRGVAKSILGYFEDALIDEERALDIIGSDRGVYIVMGSINVSAILTKMGKSDIARQKIAETLEMVQGIGNMERPKLLLRWIKALLLEEKDSRNDLKLAGQMMDRIAVRMKKHEMKAELRVLLADRARIAKDPRTITRIARRAHELEETPHVIKLIEKVMREPTKDNIAAWRNALNSYVPPFPVAS